MLLENIFYELYGIFVWLKMQWSRQDKKNALLNHTVPPTNTYLDFL